VRHPQRIIDRFKFVAVALFVASIGATAGYWLFYERPLQRCERSGNWWDPQARECGTVVYIPDLTGRYEMGGQRVRAPTALPARPVAQRSGPSA